jgi:hypothetical protein
VNRLGQSRATAVHHLVIKGTIEESVHRISTAPLAQCGGTSNGENGGGTRAAREGRMSLAEAEDLFDIPPRLNVSAP